MHDIYNLGYNGDIVSQALPSDQEHLMEAQSQPLCHVALRHDPQQKA